MKKSTQELLDILKHSPKIDTYLDTEQPNLIQKPLCDYLNRIMADKNISAGELIQKSGMQKTYLYEILRGVKTPSREKVLSLCIALALTLDETQELLKYTGYPLLYARIEKDSIIIFALTHACTVMDTNELLYEFGYAPL